MSWPLSQDYNEAIQDPSSAFKDPELRGGELRLNALGLPLPRSGNFADVYEVNCPASQSKWAVKCFTREVHGLQQRYGAISRHLKDANLPFTVDFQFLDQGIRIGAQWYPILKMRWVEGLLLNEFVRDALDKPTLLQALQQIWGRLAKRLREADIAHADLQHGNVLLVPGSKAALAVKLIDYDGMWVPALAQTKSGEVGHPNYQHPQRLREGTYNREVDRFPFLVTATALRALAVAGRTLWQRYDNGDNLLFKEADLRAPEESQLFHELSTVADPTLQGLLVPLRQACRGRLQETPLLDEVAPEEKPVVLQTGPPPVPPAAPIAKDWGPLSKPEPAGEGRGKATGRRTVRKSSVSTRAWIAGGGGLAAVLAVVVVLVLMNNMQQPDGGPKVVVHSPATNLPLPSSPSIVPPVTTKPPDTRSVPPTIRSVPPTTRTAPPDTGKIKPPPAGPPVAGGSVFRMLGSSNDLVAMTEEGPSVWRLHSLTGKEMDRRFLGHEKPIVVFGASADGTVAITSSEDGMTFWWYVPTGTRSLGLKFSKPMVAVALSADGKRSVTADGSGKVQLWDTQVGGAPKEFSFDIGIGAVAISADGQMIACGVGAGFRANRIYFGNASEKALSKWLPGHVQGITALAFSPDGRLLASGSADKEFRVWDLEKTKAQASVEGFHAPVRGLTFSPDGDRLIADAGFEAAVWSITNNKQVGKIKKAEGDRLAFAFEQDSNKVIAILAAKDGTIRREDVPLEGDPVVVKPPTIAGVPRIFRIVDAEAETIARTGTDPSVLVLQGLKGAKEVRRLSGHKGPITCFSITTDGRFAVTGSEDRTVRVWDVAGAKTVCELTDLDRPVTAAALSPDGTRALTTDGANFLALWDATNGRQIWPRYYGGGGGTAAITCVAFTPDGKLMACTLFGGDGSGKSMYIWGPPEDQSKSTTLRDLPGRVTCIAYSADNKRSAMAIEGGKVWTYDGETKATTIHAVPDRGPVTSLQFSPDGRKLLGCSPRGSYVWDMQSRKVVMQPVAFPNAAAVTAFTEDGAKVLQVTLHPNGNLQAATFPVTGGKKPR